MNNLLEAALASMPQNAATTFQIAAGSIPGRDHVGNGRLLVGKNNQDAFCVAKTATSVIGVVCDGCGSAKHSEVGAKLGARLIAGQFAESLAETSLKSVSRRSPEKLIEFAEKSRQAILSQIRVLASQMGGDFSRVIHDYFLFTAVAAVVTPEVTAVLSIGDGVVLLNDKMIRIGPFDNNAPPYLAFTLLGDDSPMQPGELQFKIRRIIPTSFVRSLALGTDGVFDLIDASENSIPGRDEAVGSITQFWQDERYFTNPDMIRRRLALINSDSSRWDSETNGLVREHGLLPDDTTLVVMRPNRTELKEPARW